MKWSTKWVGPFRIALLFFPVLFFTCLEPAGAATMATGVESLRDALARSGDNAVLLFGPRDHLADLFLPLHREGKIVSVDLVVPSEGKLTEEDATAWKSYVSTLDARADNAFSLRDGVLEGKVQGLLIRVVPIREWTRVPDRGPVILDLSFFPAMYKNEVRTPFVDLPRKFFATLEDRRVDIGRVRPWVLSPDDIPLQHGYLPKLVAEILGAPAAFRADLPAKWKALRQGEYLASFAANEEAAPYFEKFLAEEPEEASALYRLAQFRFVDQDLGEGLRLLRKAFKADIRYIEGYSEAALRFFRKGDFDRAETILRAGLISDSSSLALQQNLGGVILERAKGFLQTDPGAAEERFSEISAIGLPEDVLREFRAEWDRIKASPAPPGSPSRGKPPGHPEF